MRTIIFSVFITIALIVGARFGSASDAEKKSFYQSVRKSFEFAERSNAGPVSENACSISGGRSLTSTEYDKTLKTALKYGSKSPDFKNVIIYEGITYIIFATPSRSIGLCEFK